MAKLNFVKMHGCGNDYIYVIARDFALANPHELACRLSQRRFGIGADGLIVLLPSKVADVRMEIYNADGSRAEMCGNGIRCVARLAYEERLAARSPVVIETDAGLKVAQLNFSADGKFLSATVDMGVPILEGRKIPVNADGLVIDYDLGITGVRSRITAVSMGNPHAVVFVDDEALFALPDSEFAHLGRQFERHPFFPRGTNVEFVLVEKPDRLRMRVWERGSGETLACGTGACASVVAAALTGRGARKAKVQLRGGELEIEWCEKGNKKDHVLMTGEAVEVFRGEVFVEDNQLIPVSR